MPIEALYTVVPLIIVSVLFYFTARDESKLLDLSEKPAHTINVVGFQWSWGFNYVENVDGNPATPASEVPKELSAIPDKLHRRPSRRAPTASTTRASPATRNPQNRQPGSDPVAAQGREGPVRPDVA